MTDDADLRKEPLFLLVAEQDLLWTMKDTLVRRSVVSAMKHHQWPHANVRRPCNRTRPCRSGGRMGWCFRLHLEVGKLDEP